MNALILDTYAINELEVDTPVVKDLAFSGEVSELVDLEGKIL